VATLGGVKSNVAPRFAKGTHLPRPIRSGNPATVESAPLTTGSQPGNTRHAGPLGTVIAHHPPKKPHLQLLGDYSPQKGVGVDPFDSTTLEWRTLTVGEFAEGVWMPPSANLRCRCLGDRPARRGCGFEFQPQFVPWRAIQHIADIAGTRILLVDEFCESDDPPGSEGNSLAWGVNSGSGCSWVNPHRSRLMILVSHQSVSSGIPVNGCCLNSNADWHGLF